MENDVSDEVEIVARVFEESRGEIRDHGRSGRIIINLQ